MLGRALVGQRLIGREDPDISDAVQDILAREGIAIRLGADDIRFARDGDGVAVTASKADPVPIRASHVLVATGRRPNTDDLGLDAAGVETDAGGYVTVDESLQSTVPHIWAMGDCNGRGAFTHTAFNDFEIVASNLLDGGARRVTDRTPAYALYIDPPLGRTGMTEAEARAAGKRVRVGMRPMSRVGRAVERGETAGFLKVVIDADSDAVLGAAILGVEGDEAIHSIIDGMALGASAATFRSIMHIHPTVAELIPTVFGELGDPG